MFYNSDTGEYKVLPIILAGSSAIIGLWAIFGSFQTIDSGEVGVKVSMGKVDEVPLTEGFHTMSPVSTDVFIFSTRLMSTDYTVQAYTKDVQQTDLKVQVAYNLNPQSAPNIYKVSGTNWQANLFDGLVVDAIKGVAGQWEAVDMISSRNKVVDQIKARIIERLAERLKERGVSETAVTINMASIVDIQFGDDFEKAVESKVKAVQDAERAKNETVRIREEAEQKVIAAKAEAESMEIRTRALAQNNALVEYEAVQKWNGVLPTYMMGNSVPFISIK